MDLLKSLKKDLSLECPKSFDDCVKWARLQFQENFHNTIAQLLYNFPSDQVDY